MKFDDVLLSINGKPCGKMGPPELGAILQSSGDALKLGIERQQTTAPDPTSSPTPAPTPDIADGGPPADLASGAESTVCCPNGHPLAPFSTPDGEHECDKCNTSLAGASTHSHSQP